MALSKTMKPKHEIAVKSIISKDLPEIEMTISQNASGHIMGLLTNLYPNAVASTVREVVSNAVDACAMAGSREPIKISGPTRMAPYFIVEDSGTGMSYDVIKNVLSSYGETLKEGNFQTLGAYGIGFKAPLAYTNSFVVRTVCDGVAHEFSVNRGDGGNKIKFLNISETKELNGTKVTVPVEEKDIAEFSIALENYKNGVHIIPMELNGVLLSNDDTYHLVGEMLLDEESNTSGRVWVKLSGDSDFYSILEHSNGQLNHNLKYSLGGWTYGELRQNYYHSANFVLELKPGVVNFASSRDEISRDSKFEKLQEKFSKFVISEDANKNLSSVLLQYYRCMSPKQSLALYCDSRYKSCLSKIFVQSSDWVLNDDFNPSDFLKVADRILAVMEVDTKSITPSFDLSVPYTLDSTMPGYSKDDGIKFGYPNLRDGRVSQKRALLKDIVSQNTTASVAETRVASEISGGGYCSKFVVFEEFDEKFAAEFVKHRTLVGKYGFACNTYIIALPQKISRKWWSMLQKVQPTFEKINYTGFVDLVAEARKEKKNSQEPAVKSKTFPSLVLSKSFEAGKDLPVLKEMQNTYSSNKVEYLSLGEIIESNAVVLVVDSLARYLTPLYTLYGCINSGDDISGRKIIAVANLKSDQFNRLQKYKDVYVSAGNFSKSASFRKIVQTQLRYSQSLSSEVEAMPTNQLFSQLTRYRFSYLNDSDYLQLLSKIVNDAKLKNALGEMSKILTESTKSKKLKTKNYFDQNLIAQELFKRSHSDTNLNFLLKFYILVENSETIANPYRRTDDKISFDLIAVCSILKTMYNHSDIVYTSNSTAAKMLNEMLVNLIDEQNLKENLR